jgi:F-type H+-transporting ATPase subunit b
LQILGLEPKVLIVQVVAFLILFFILKKFLFTRITQHLESRRDEIRSAYETIAQKKQEVEGLAREYKGKLDQIEQEAYNRIQQAVKEGTAIKNEIIAEAHTQAQKELEKAKGEIAREKQKAIIELRSQVINLSLAAAEKVIEVSVDRQVHTKLVEDFLKDVEGMGLQDLEGAKKE